MTLENLHNIILILTISKSDFFSSAFNANRLIGLIFKVITGIEPFHVFPKCKFIYSDCK